MGTKWLEPTEREVGSVLRRSDLGLAALAGAGATLVAVGLLLPIYGPRSLTIEPCTEDGVTLYDGSCGHPDVNDFHDGFWWPVNHRVQGQRGWGPVGPGAGTDDGPLRLEKGDK